MTDVEPMPPNGKRRRNPGVVFVVLVAAMSGLYLWTSRPVEVPSGWLTDLDEALRLAADSERHVFVNFSADWCPPCREMKRNVFSDARVREALAGFVSVHIDTDVQAQVARRFGVAGLPTMMVMDADRRIITRFDGALTVEGFLQFLKSVG
ncbi:MAG: thioredoxin fold domain-containing protein [bacterium]|nr:thioredoxin fold domain-containing protein [bacterium]